ncbi:hypothetical protein QR680_000567 [Steinernema hermaphroditum]|uniref:Major facilitator superfamily (MFS) profile domain-containing protein n=1 Tax=Steinernema hermaphroditum TaxID=289476 RepID=A0AA39GX17_9BILA|nr:hypothetical protein QR680_000567 [Steinernema hermaphroditum]
MSEHESDISSVDSAMESQVSNPSIPEPPISEPPTDWRSIYVVSALGFSCAVQFSVYYTSLWPYLDIIDKKATETFFGFIIGAYSLGQIVASPTFGYWSNRIKSIKLPMYAGLLAMFIGNVIYLTVELLPHGRRYALLIARTITGVGAASVGLVKTYASTSCKASDRAKAVTYVTGGIALGVTIGPAIQIVFTPVGYPGLVFFRGLTISMYTAPAWVACLMNIVSAIAMATMLKETYAGIVKEQKTNNEEGDSPIDLNPVPKYDWIAVILCNITRFTQQFINTNLETVGSPLAMQVFAFTKQQTVKYGSIAQGGMGIMSLITYVAFIFGDLSRFMDYRIGTIGSLVLFLLFHLITYPWPFIPEGLTTYSKDDLLNATHEVVGCNVDKFTWCNSTSYINVWLYYVSFAIIMGICFTSMNITLNTIYGRILGPRRQGTMQGVLLVSGGLARMIGPVIISTLYSVYGPEISWIVEIAILAVNLALWAIFYKRTVPLKLIHERERGVAIRVKKGNVYRM